LVVGRVVGRMGEQSQDFRNGINEFKGEVGATLKALNDSVGEIKSNQRRTWQAIDGLREAVTERFDDFRQEEIAPLQEKVGTLQAFRWKLVGIVGGLSVLIAVGGLVARIIF